MKKIASRLLLFVALCLPLFTALGQSSLQHLWTTRTSPLVPGISGRLYITNIGVSSFDSTHHAVVIKYNTSFQLRGVQYDCFDSVPRTMLVQLGSRGIPNWSRRLPGTDSIGVTQVKHDSLGNLYVAGEVWKTCSIGGTQITCLPGDVEYFIAKWTPAGQLAWVHSGGGQGRKWLRSLCISRAGEVYFAGEFLDSARFQTTTLYAARRNGFCAKISASGALIWVKNLENLSHVPGSQADVYDIALNSFEDVYLLGAGGVSIDGHTINSAFQFNLFWLKLNSAGTYQASDSFGRFRRDQYVYTYAIIVDKLNNFYVSGSSLDGPVTIQGHLIYPSLGGHNIIGAFLAKFDPSGQLVWLQPLAVGGDQWSQIQIMDLVLDRTNNPVVAGFWGMDADNYVAIGSVQFLAPASSGFISCFNRQDGDPSWIQGQIAPLSLEGLHTSFSQNKQGQFLFSDAALGDDISVANQTYSVAAGSTITSFLSLFTPDQNTVSGIVFNDDNHNQIQDSGETPKAGVIIQALPGPVYCSSNQAGEYDMSIALGNYSLSVPQPPAHYTAPPPASYAFSTYGNAVANQNIALQPIPNQQDLRVLLTPVNRARPGFALTYRLTARNIGTVPVAAAALQLAVDPLLSFVSSTTPGALSGNTFSVVLGTLQPGETRNVDVLYQIAVTAPVNHVLVGTGTLNPTAADLTPADNVEVSNLTVTGSYDPNDIAVNFPTLLLPDVQNAVRPLDYTVRFQNMGTDTAFTAVIRDTLPANMLYLGTLQVLASSHSCTWRLGPGGVLTVTFPNIRLPHRNANTLRSMGFVRFRMMPYTTLAIGDLVTNEADIHFDFNAPINTNTALTTVVGPTGLTPETATALSGGAWPNPATGTLHVALARPTVAPVTLTLTDAVGRTAQTRTAPAASGPYETTLDVTGLAPGLYLLRAQAAGRGFSQRVVVR